MALIKEIQERPDAAIHAALVEAIRLAESEFSPLRFEGEFPLNGFGIQELRPFHVENTTTNIPQTSNLNYWETTIVVASEWNDWINVTNDRDQFLIIAGMFTLDADPSTTEVFPNGNGVDLPIINIEQTYGLQESRFFFRKPFIVKPNGNLTIQLYGRGGGVNGASQRVGLIGFAVAKRSRLILKS